MIDDQIPQDRYIPERSAAFIKQKSLNAVVMVLVAIFGADVTIFDDVIPHDLTVASDTNPVRRKIGDYVAFTNAIRGAKIDSESRV